MPKIHKIGVPLRPIINIIGSPASFLAKLIAPLVRNTLASIMDSSHFFEFIKDKTLVNFDLLMSFYVVSLFTKVPIQDSLEIFKWKTNDEIATLVKLCLRSTFFLFQDIIYEQVDGVAMGLPLSPIIGNLYMEHFEEIVLTSFPLKPRWWKRYVDDTIFFWSHDLLWELFG